MSKQEILHLTAELCGVEETDTACAFAVDRSMEMVCAYCGIDEVPEGLNGVCTAIAVELFQTEGFGKDGGRMVTRITEGDVAVQFAAVKEHSYHLLQAYREELNRYRNAKW